MLKQEVALAQSICNRCHILEECDSYAKQQKGLYGVWAGKVYDGEGYESPFTVMPNGVIVDRKIA